MKAQVVTFEQEGFAAAYGIKFENGLVLRGPNLLWCGKTGREEITKQFADVINAICAGELSPLTFTPPDV